MFISTHKNDDSTPKHVICKLGNDNPITPGTNAVITDNEQENILLCQTINSSVQKVNGSLKNMASTRLLCWPLVPLVLKIEKKERKKKKKKAAGRFMMTIVVTR